MSVSREGKRRDLQELRERQVDALLATAPRSKTKTPRCAEATSRSFPSSTPEDVREALDAADNAYRSWKRTPLAERQNYIAEFLRLLKGSREELARIVTLENGKTIKESRAEVDSALVEGSYHLNQVAAFSGHSGPGAFRDISTWVQYQPLGVAGIISPWNFPMNVMNRKALPALLTGNTVVFKPASFTPGPASSWRSFWSVPVCLPGVFNCVTGLGSGSATSSWKIRACARFRSRGPPKSARRSR